MKQTPTPASRFSMLPGETPQDAAARLELPCKVVQTRHGCLIIVGRLNREQIDAFNRYAYRRELRECEPLAAPTPVAEAVSA